VRTHLATLVADFRRHGAQTAIVCYRGNRRHPTTYLQLAELEAAIFGLDCIGS
jgi:long-chain acyl-CoA synthetase